MYDSDFISSQNVLSVAKALLRLDKQCIKPTLHPDAGHFIDDLKLALYRVQHPNRSSANDTSLNPLLFDESFTDLIKVTQNFYTILTDEGKELVHHLLKDRKRISAF